jgi:proline iminopeptidase
MPFHSDQIKARIADLRQIHTPEGIEILEPVELGGTQQWISIRGRNRDNPVLLMIHGGPGSPMMPTSWAFQSPWEDFFTVVQWDQRGVGKNYFAADHKALAPTLRISRVVQDAEELVDHLRERLGKDKIVVMGFSWGTIIGLHLAKSRSQSLSAYIGVGQSVDMHAEQVIYERLIGLARASTNEQALKELEAIAPYPDSSSTTPLSDVLIVRKWARFFNGGWYGKPDFSLYFSLPEWAPEYTHSDSEFNLEATHWAGENLINDLLTDDLHDLGPSFQVPFLMLMGRFDLHTPYEPAKTYFDQISAPYKKFITFERSAHFPMFEEPGRFLMTLVNEVLPLTGEQVSFKPIY